MVPTVPFPVLMTISPIWKLNIFIVEFQFLSKMCGRNVLDDLLRKLRRMGQIRE